ncbi:GOLPH3/VPS74 family protein [Mycolicibacterium helvum]|uniref:GPP34 family phosphoprotein n=1 Tax=Mycolicibacterium helvum TaxID=1534349 RepID=A0A7I7T2M9_9MYCO|nr:GPP34 family phosphoprotein [Mycolicibacterium helvum]BBY63200.1 hypothetical protein MHEL_14430 [Mycolicibacterium helvum]
MERIGGLLSDVSHVPATLHGQLFLLAFDPKRGRFASHDSTLFGLALGAAMLTELYLTGFLVERDGHPVPGKAASPDDQVLGSAFAQVGVHNRATWAQLIAGQHGSAVSLVRDQLITEGWLRTGRLAVLEVPAAALEPYDACRVGALAGGVVGALRNAIAGKSAEPWLLACGLLAVHAELPGLADFAATADRRRLQQLERHAIAPVCGLAEAIQSRSL